MKSGINELSDLNRAVDVCVSGKLKVTSGASSSSAATAFYNEHKLNLEVQNDDCSQKWLSLKATMSRINLQTNKV